MKNQKLFIVRKYIWEKSAQEAIKKDRKTPVCDVWVDENFKTASSELKDSIGFYHKR